MPPASFWEAPVPIFMFPENPVALPLPTTTPPLLLLRSFDDPDCKFTLPPPNFPSPLLSVKCPPVAVADLPAIKLIVAPALLSAVPPRNIISPLLFPCPELNKMLPEDPPFDESPVFNKISPLPLLIPPLLWRVILPPVCKKLRPDLTKTFPPVPSVLSPPKSKMSPESLKLDPVTILIPPLTDVIPSPLSPVRKCKFPLSDNWEFPVFIKMYPASPFREDVPPDNEISIAPLLLLSLLPDLIRTAPPVLSVESPANIDTSPPLPEADFPTNMDILPLLDKDFPAAMTIPPD